jgi:predicted TIM-barrel fold metal-dependent hydrolase
VSVFEEAKIDSHCHVVDPARFPYGEATPYRPAGQEIGPLEQYLAVMEAYGIAHALFVGPNSGYGLDNSCLLDALARGAGRFRGVAVVPPDASVEDLMALKARGVVGIAFNATVHGTAHYLAQADLVRRMVDCGLFLNLQVEGDQLVDLLPLLEVVPQVHVDHCGRPVLASGLGQPGFQSLLALGRQGRAVVKLSGFAKFAREPWPHRDAWPFIEALVEAFGLGACVWASDWPYLRAPERVDVGPMLKLVERLFPRAEDRRTLFFDTPARLYGFGGA